MRPHRAPPCLQRPLIFANCFCELFSTIAKPRFSFTHRHQLLRCVRAQRPLRLQRLLVIVDRLAVQANSVVARACGGQNAAWSRLSTGCSWEQSPQRGGTLLFIGQAGRAEQGVGSRANEGNKAAL